MGPFDRPRNHVPHRCTQEKKNVDTVKTNTGKRMVGGVVFFAAGRRRKKKERVRLFGRRQCHMIHFFRFLFLVFFSKDDRPLLDVS
jgi:hypothetical protein